MAAALKEQTGPPPPGALPDERRITATPPSSGEVGVRPFSGPSPSGPLRGRHGQRLPPPAHRHLQNLPSRGRPLGTATQWGLCAMTGSPGVLPAPVTALQPSSVLAGLPEGPQTRGLAPRHTRCSHFRLATRVPQPPAHLGFHNRPQAGKRASTPRDLGRARSDSHRLRWAQPVAGTLGQWGGRVSVPSLAWKPSALALRVFTDASLLGRDGAGLRPLTQGRSLW